MASDELTKLFNLIFRSNKMPEEWRRSILVPIFKNKVKASRPLIRVLVINDNGLWINDFI